MEFITQLLNGLSLGSIYALVALGYSMVYGIVQLINFAHGDIIMVGGYTIYLVMVVAGLPAWLAVLAPIVVCALAGVLIERIAYHRLLTHNAERISLLITALGVSLFLQNLFMLLFKADAKNLQGMDGYIELGGLQITNTTLINIIVSVIMMVMLQLLVNKTKIGKAMQAMREAGVEPIVRPIRGGTDGARLSYMGLPCPNLFTGGMNFHGKFEYCSLDTMGRAVRTILNLARLWAE